MLAILDYKAGNQTSVARALQHLDIPCRITANPHELDSYDGIIFPGVGSAPQAMAELSRTGLDAALRRLAAKGQPLLGICLGSQILLERSEEGDVKTLGILSGECVRFENKLRQEDGSLARIPHMGWNCLKRAKPNRIFNGIPEDAEFYFVHSYYTRPRPDMILATSMYGHEFCAVYGRDGLWATQFHPEKSGRHGLALLANFNAWCMEAAHAV